MKLCYIALALSAPSAFGYGENCNTTSAPFLSGADVSYIGKVLDNPGTFYYFSDQITSEPGFRICPLNDTSGSFTISAGDCVLTNEGCVTSIGWPGISTLEESNQDMQSCVFSGVTAAKVMNFSTEEDYDYVAYGDCVPETPIALFQKEGSSLSDCGTDNMTGERGFTSNPGHPDYAGPEDGLFKCVDFSMGTSSVDLQYGDDGDRSYSRSFYGCQEAYYSAPNCQEADLVDITAENYANFNHSDEFFQAAMREFGSQLQNFTHPRVPNVRSYDPSGACQELQGIFVSTSCECLEGYCLYYECAQGSYGGQELSCSVCTAACVDGEYESTACTSATNRVCTACGANCAQCASATLCDVCDTVTNGSAVAIGGDNSCTVSCDTGFYTVDGTVDGATCVDCAAIDNCDSVSCSTGSDQICVQCAAGYAGEGTNNCTDCAAIDNCDSVSCSTGSDQICVQCAAGYAGEGTNNCTEIPSGQTTVFVVSSVYTFNSAFTAADIPNAKQDVATAADVETSKVEMEIRAAERRKRAEEVVVDVEIQFDDFATAEAKAIALEATPVVFTNLKAGNSEVQDPVVGPYAASTVLVQDNTQDNTSSAPVFVGSLVMAILALF